MCTPIKKRSIYVNIVHHHHLTHLNSSTILELLPGHRAYGCRESAIRHIIVIVLISIIVLVITYLLLYVNTCYYSYYYYYYCHITNTIYILCNVIIRFSLKIIMCLFYTKHQRCYSFNHLSSNTVEPYKVHHYR